MLVELMQHSLELNIADLMKLMWHYNVLFINDWTDMTVKILVLYKIFKPKMRALDPM